MAKPTLLQAVVELYDTIGGGLPTLWLDEVPEGGTASGFPRAVLRDGGQITDAEVNEDDGSVPSCIHPFSIEIIVENDSDSAETLGLLVLTAFTPAAIALTFDSNARLEHDNGKRTVTTRGILIRSPADKPLYSCSITYAARYGTNY